ncbi:hypothetical protein ACN47E_005697 [Coniothyrium glycines]
MPKRHVSDETPALFDSGYASDQSTTPSASEQQVLASAYGSPTDSIKHLLTDTEHHNDASKAPKTKSMHSRQHKSPKTDELPITPFTEAMERRGVELNATCITKLDPRLRLAKTRSVRRRKDRARIDKLGRTRAAARTRAAGKADRSCVSGVEDVFVVTSAEEKGYSFEDALREDGGADGSEGEE